MQICCAGEVMVELAGTGASGGYQQGFAGDTYNTAIYLARAGLGVDYLTRLGDDRFSDAIVKDLEDERIGIEGVFRIPGRQPGLYLICNDAQGEREFHYWRDSSPAREMFEQPLTPPQCRAFYFSGITLAVTRSGIENLKELLVRLKQQGSAIVFDPNYRSALWDSDAQARDYCRQVLPHCSMVLPTLEDDHALWGIDSPQESAAMYMDSGASEVVVKGADLVAHAFCEAQIAQRQAEKVAAVDTTGAGDSFNAAYLAARLQGAPLDLALAAGQQLAAKVVQHRGALLPRVTGN
jgi:2-dehydro-3-deoxygluconokinase